VLLGDPPKIKSARSILCDQKTLIKVLISFYEDREEDVEEDVNVREEENEYVFVREHKVSNLFSVSSNFLLYCNI
jgi:hypothetical protein